MTATLARAAAPAEHRERATQRLTVGRVVPVILAIVAVVTFLAVIRDRTATVLVPVSARTIPAGSPVTGSAVTTVRLAASSPLRSGIVSLSTLTGGGWVAASTIPAGEPITASELVRASAGNGLSSMSITITPDHADGGNLATGDQVDVITALNGQATYVARGLQVISVASRSSSGLTSSSSNYFVAVAVNPQQALALTAALQSGTQGILEIVKAAGVSP